MTHLKVGHIVEAALWLLLVALLYAGSFQFDREIEIYRFGASAWPRAVLLLIAIAAIGQLAYHWQAAGDAAHPSSAPDDDAPAAGDHAVQPGQLDQPTHSPHASLKWYLSTFFLLSLPFAYMVLPQWIHAWLLDPAATDNATNATLHTIRLICAGVLLALYVAGIRDNLVGAMLALPIFFGALMQDLGFYALAPVFAAGVMYLMGERRAGWIALITAMVVGLMLMLFVSVLYVGLPTGNISPFYDLGTGLVNLLQ